VKHNLLIVFEASTIITSPSIICTIATRSPLSGQWLLLESKTIAMQRIIVSSKLQVTATAQ
jgi:hypothetical protein